MVVFNYISNKTILIFENSLSVKLLNSNWLSKSNESGSLLFDPTIESNSNDISSGVFAKHPGVVKTGIFGSEKFYQRLLVLSSV